MRPAARDVVITGLGAVSALAPDGPGLWEAVARGRAGIAPIRRFPTDDFAVKTGALVAACAEAQPPSAALTGELCRRFARDAGREALRSSRSAAAGGTGPDAAPSADPARVAVVFGTGLGGLDAPVHALAEELAGALGALGPRLTVSTACSSSTGAIGLGRDLLALDAADVVIAGGADVLSPEVFAGFHALGVLNPAACAPFSLPFGTTLGEGAGFLILERGADARRRGARIFATLAGYGLSGDAYHETSPDPQGTGIERAIRGALADAAVPAEAIGYVNVHGSGTEANDPAEWRGIQRGLGAHAEAIPLSSTKGALGHAQGAAGALEAIVTIQAMAHDTVPPTLNFTTPRLYAPPDPVPGPAPRTAAYAHALSLNAAFGGANAALVLSRPEGARAPAARRPVFVTGVGRWPASDVASADAAPLDLAALVPHADTRGLDPMSRFLTGAAALALRDGKVRLRGPLRDAAGLFVGQLTASPESHAVFRRSIEAHGLAHLSAAAFARIVLNAAAGTCSKLLALRGPLTAITTGAGSGLVALVLAAETLSTRDEVQLMVAGGADEADGPDAPEGAASTGAAESAAAEGAACLLLAREPAAGAPQVRVCGWALAGPGRLPDAVARALAMDDDADAADDPVGFDADAAQRAAPSARTTAEAVAALRSGACRRALVTSDAGDSACAALLLARE